MAALLALLSAPFVIFLLIATAGAVGLVAVLDRQNR